jgi:DNA-binding NarL/FixJ family response regulator
VVSRPLNSGRSTSSSQPPLSSPRRSCSRAQRARAELSRSDTGRRRAVGLTAAEQRIAELAAAGVTNRDMASTLFISPKTVEANLTRIYRKLNIHSRAELGRIMGQFDS